VKIQSFVAGCVGGIGVFFAAVGGLDAGGTVLLAVGSYHSTPNFMATMGFQYLALCVPFFVGLTFLFCAARLGRLICRFARIGDMELPVLNDATALTLGCLVTGLFVAVRATPELVTILYWKMVTAANPVTASAYLGVSKAEDLIRVLVALALAALLIFKAKAIANWLIRHYERS
jgi:hypothetical protein